MTLTLRIRHGGSPAGGQTSERKLDRGRIVLGRGADSDWVLADPERTVSKRHCVIEQTEHGFEITDLSTNGVFLNDEDEPVGIGNTRPLRHGDRIRIGPYTLSVELPSDKPAPTPLAELTGFDTATGLAAPEPVAHGAMFRGQGLSDLDRGTPADAFFAPQPQTLAGGTSAALAWPSTVAAPAVMPIPEKWAEAVVPGRQPMPEKVPDIAQLGPLIIPVDWDTAPPPANPPPAPVPNTVMPAMAPAVAVAAADPPPAADRSASASEAVAAFCAGAGLDPSVLSTSSPDEAMRRAGELLRIAVDGLMAVLASRRSLKNEFRLSATEFRPVENNPLKFSVDADQALQMLIGRPQRGFLPATEAFREAVDDLRMHEVAILAGMQEAWLTQLQRFNPRDLSERLEDDSGLVNFLGSKKARCWDAFVTLYDSIAGNADNEWERTFQNIFGAAYERSMQKQRTRSG